MIWVESLLYFLFLTIKNYYIFSYKIIILLVIYFLSPHKSTSQHNACSHIYLKSLWRIFLKQSPRHTYCDKCSSDDNDCVHFWINRYLEWVGHVYKSLESRNSYFAHWRGDQSVYRMTNLNYVNGRRGKSFDPHLSTQSACEPSSP